ncbi:MAG TPA: hypothetical protein VFV99_30035 [Kofleriaceae bacterium]|nr:hypothetical protein [Kofleriaceae bacterium]
MIELIRGAYHEGGWGMYPTTFLGLVLIAAAIRYLRNPERRRLHLARHLNVLVGLSGTLGFFTGVIKTFTNLPSDQLYIAFIGVGESLHNVTLALCMMIVARIIVAFGAAKDTDSASDLVAP